MATITGVVKSPIKGELGTLHRSSGYEYRDFTYTQADGTKVRVVGWHRAIDITTLGTIVAFEKGKVVYNMTGVKGQTTNPSGGNQVKLEHANGDKTIYAHLDYMSNDHLKIGDIVQMGDKLGTDIVETTGNSTGRHLHFAIYNKSTKSYVDPTDYLQGKVSLKPFGFTEPVNDSYYAVKKGDNLSSIASKHNIDWKELYEINKKLIGSNPNLIKVGLKLQLTNNNKAITYVVKKGDNLSSIAKKYGKEWESIYETNKSTIGPNANMLQIGTKLTIK